MNWLTAEQGSRRKLISVWGMGGLGKTTLVSKVFKSQVVKEHFHSRAWVTVSETYTVDDLLRKILRELFGQKGTMPDIDNVSQSNLIETLNTHLQDKRYLLVLDDVWSTSAWRDVNNALTVGDYQSRIILTTRSRDVASLGDHVMEPQPLDDKDAWVLFCKKAFYSEGGVGCPTHLEHWAKAILDKCQGFPLAIVALGSLLSLRDKEELEWKRVYDGLSWQLINNPQLSQLKNILLVSYKNLPDYLQPCLLYCSIFPEDYLIKRNRLVRLWVAEGLVQSRGRLTMEEVAEDNLNELIYRRMLQVAERNEFGRVRSCRMHDMMREVALQISEREKFSSVQDNPDGVLNTEARRLSIHKFTEAIEHSTDWVGRLRSFLFFDNSSPCIASQFCSVSSGFKLLQVLDLQRAPIDSVPENVYHLFNLHYLSLRDTGIRDISESLQMLCKLETLDLRDTNLKRLPCGVTKLKKLRHLMVGCRIKIKGFFTFTYALRSGMKPPKGLWKLRELQTMKIFEASEEFVRHARGLIKLRKFGIIKVKATHYVELCVAISKMVQLYSLFISASEEDGENILDLDTMSSPPQYLQRLCLWGRLKNGALPNWFSTLRNLKLLCLHWSRLREDSVPLLHETLPSLVRLELSNAHEGRGICFRAGWFPKLKSLFLLNMPVEEIEIEEGALTRLERFYLCLCPQLRNVPHGIEHLTALRELALLKMDPELVTKLRVDVDTRERVRGIERIQHVYMADEDQFYREDLKVSS